MKSNVQTFLIVVGSVAIGALGSYFAFCDKGDELSGTTVAGARVIKTKVSGSVKKVTEISLEENNGKKSVRIVEAQQFRPRAEVVAAPVQPDDIEEDDLTEAQKGVLKELQDALDDNNLKQVRKVLRKFSAKVDNGGLGGQVPACMRSQAVAALGWFGKDAAVDLIGFAADANEDIASEANSALEQALSDCEMGDRERSEMLTALMTALTDAEQIDTFLNQLNDMRNSVKADAAKAILASGTDAAKGVLREQLEMYFDEDVADAATLEKWKAMNPDDPDDAETYGGQK